MTRTIKVSLLFFFVSLCAAAVFVTHHVRRAVPPPAPHDLFSVVEEQLAAFRVAGYSSAYRHAASEVQRKFTMPQFEEMIRRDYGEMTNAQHIEFGFVKINATSALVHVSFVCQSGSPRSFWYNLIAEGDSWKIRGVDPARTSRSGNRPPGLQI